MSLQCNSADVLYCLYCEFGLLCLQSWSINEHSFINKPSSLNTGEHCTCYLLGSWWCVVTQAHVSLSTVFVLCPDK
jgi:hypothetical protein